MIHVYENPIRYLNARQLYSNIDVSKNVFIIRAFKSNTCLLRSSLYNLS